MQFGVFLMMGLLSIISRTNGRRYIVAYHNPTTISPIILSAPTTTTLESHSATTTTYFPSTSPLVIPTTQAVTTPLPNAETTTITTPSVTPESSSTFSWIIIALIILILVIAIAYFVILKICATPGGTYHIPKTNLVPKDYYVNFCKIDEEFIEIHSRALYGPAYVTSDSTNYDEIPIIESMI